MNLLPYEKFTIEPRISREEAISVLSHRLKNLDLLDELSLEIKSAMRENVFKGAVKPEGFNIRRLNGLGIAFVVARGKFQGDDTGLKINILITHPMWINALYIFYLCAGIYLFLSMAWSGDVKTTLSFFIPIGMIIYFMIMYRYNLEADNAKV